MTVRAGDDTRTVAFAGRGRLGGIPMTWVAEMRPDGEVAVHPTFDGETPEGIDHLLTGMAQALSGAVMAASAAAAGAYRAAIAQSLGDVAVQRALFL